MKGLLAFMAIFVAVGGSIAVYSSYAFVWPSSKIIPSNWVTGYYKAYVCTQTASDGSNGTRLIYHNISSKIEQRAIFHIYYGPYFSGHEETSVTLDNILPGQVSFTQLPVNVPSNGYYKIETLVKNPGGYTWKGGNYGQFNGGLPSCVGLWPPLKVTPVTYVLNHYYNAWVCTETEANGTAVARLIYRSTSKTAIQRAILHTYYGPYFSNKEQAHATLDNIQPKTQQINQVGLPYTSNGYFKIETQVKNPGDVEYHNLLGAYGQFQPQYTQPCWDSSRIN